ncbi:hypothetical protein CHS0354_012035 [Potamilus streckersoni]|uniref:Dolichol phosphate-mannose biosynthesis regulatory protein n=1 Tax=Potamilus streckersoni TaxID=2493646 RepID=A0AAE0TLA3_9BIVA|nr:hypothetical protein CHS0354_012035 [Potamilus streckersoni]
MKSIGATQEHRFVLDYCTDFSVLMASVKDKVIGWCLVDLSSIIFIYYTIWVIILPFVDKEQRIHYLFPDIVYAVAIPLMTGVLGLLFIGSFIAITLLRSMPKDKSN